MFVIFVFLFFLCVFWFLSYYSVCCYWGCMAGSIDSFLSPSVGLYSFLVGSIISLFGRISIVLVYCFGIFLVFNLEFNVIALDFFFLGFIVFWISAIIISIVYIFVGIGIFFFYTKNYGTYRSWEYAVHMGDVCGSDMYVFLVYGLNKSGSIGSSWLVLLRVFILIICFLVTVGVLFFVV